MDIDTPPPAGSWATFKATFVGERNNLVELAPLEDEKLRIFFSSDDVRLDFDETGNKRVSIRVKCRYVELRILPGSRYADRKVGEVDQDCAAGSECISGTKFCCGTHENVGYCDGETRCPK
ncbi:hypothetical protein [Bradyrhizobium diazoefficiens]